MSEAHVAKFSEIVAKDPALYARLGLEQVSDEASAGSFLTKAVNEAKAVGLQFTEAEGGKWMKEETAKASKGELSDTQLEAVAGGKGESAAPVREQTRAESWYNDPRNRARADWMAQQNLIWTTYQRR